MIIPSSLITFLLNIQCQGLTSRGRGWQLRLVTVTSVLTRTLEAGAGGQRPGADLANVRTQQHHSSPNCSNNTWVAGRCLLVHFHQNMIKIQNHTLVLFSTRMDLVLDWLPCTFFPRGRGFWNYFLRQTSPKGYWSKPLLVFYVLSEVDWRAERIKRKSEKCIFHCTVFFVNPPRILFSYINWWFSFFSERTWNQASFETFISTILSAET